jgi:hypothetical protein
MIGLTMLRAGLHTLAAICGGLGFFFLWVALYQPGMWPMCLVCWLVGVGTEYFVREDGL